MNEAQCTKCGAIFTFESDAIPGIVRCVCENNKFELLKAIAA